MTAAARRVASAYSAHVREGAALFFGWGLGPSAGPARWGWWCRWPSGRLDYLGPRGVVPVTP